MIKTAEFLFLFREDRKICYSTPMVENLNMDFTERVVIETVMLDWVSTRMTGVERWMLEREKTESGRATSVVRYAPGSYFSPHTHGGGKEFIVLDCVLRAQPVGLSAQTVQRR